jgi:hypothetical protein
MDRRDRNLKWYLEFDEHRMMVTFEEENGDEIEIPVIYSVCDTCDGQGKHVNPSIDSNGITESEFAEDPDFRENYFSGMYDQTCNECGGRRVVPTPDPNRATPHQIKLIADYIESMYRDDLERDAERRMGA